MIEGLAEYRTAVNSEARQRRLLAEDYAASQVLAGCGDADTFLAELLTINHTDPRRARDLYFTWTHTLNPPSRAPLPVYESAETIWAALDPHVRRRIAGLAPQLARQLTKATQ